MKPNITKRGTLRYSIWWVPFSCSLSFMPLRQLRPANAKCENAVAADGFEPSSLKSSLIVTLINPFKGTLF